MKRILLITVALVLLAAAGAVVGSVYYRRLCGLDETTWTTRSRAAHDELVEGLKDLNRYYRGDAKVHFERALELDPECISAKLFLSYGSPSHNPASEEMVKALGTADLSGLRPRERFLVRHRLLVAAGREEEAGDLLDAFLRDNPDDEFALRMACDRLWSQSDYEEAGRCYAHLIEIHPNRVEAQNRLGYTALYLGRFAEAEEHFRTYRFIAPDQANPNDSLGELLTVVGRYDEAEQAFREALRIKSDFCDSYSHLYRLYLVAGDWGKMARLADEVESSESCPNYVEHGEPCLWRGVATSRSGDPEGGWRQIEEDCPERIEAGEPMIHLLAVDAGRTEVADRVEAQCRERIERREEEIGTHAAGLRAALALMEGRRALLNHDYTTASQRLLAADQALPYWGDYADLKLYNRLLLSYTLRLEGRTDAAEKLLQELGRVNPRVARIRIDEIEPRLADLGGR